MKAYIIELLIFYSIKVIRSEPADGCGVSSDPDTGQPGAMVQNLGCFHWREASLMLLEDRRC